MLIDDAERYIALRRSLGFKLREPARHLQSFALFAAERSEAHVHVETAVTWAATAPTRGARHRRLSNVVRFARFLRAESAAHEIPPTNLFAAPESRPVPYIYTPDELVRILETAGRLRRQKPNLMRAQMYVMLFGLIAATGLRVSEALNLRLDDLLPCGVLQIRNTKFGKSRLVPLHKTVIDALNRYLDLRRRFAGSDDHLFLSITGKALAHEMANYTFRRVLRLANIAPGRVRRPRIHDLRHTFATRVLEQCSTRRDAVARHFVALATYMGHTDIAYTYWYLQATPELMTDIAAAAEALIAGEAA
jgi:integrase